jgi:hypothetical protein
MQPLACLQAIEALFDSEANLDHKRADIEKAIRHLSECPHCEKRMELFLGALNSGEENQLTCDECLELLPDYLSAEEAGEAHTEIWHPVIVHLDTCPNCSAACEELKDMLDLAFADHGVELPHYPTPDLSFLRPNWVQVALESGRAWLEQETGRWRQLVLSLPTLVSGPQRAPAVMGLMGDEDAAPEAAQQTLAPDEANFEIKLAVAPDKAEAGTELCRLDIVLTLFDRLGDFSGVPVVLSWGNEEQTLETDPLGKVSFMELPCDQLPIMRLTVKLPE